MSAVAQYRVRAGDGLERIAKRLGTTEAALRAANPGKLSRRSAMIHPGDILLVPQRPGTLTQAPAQRNSQAQPRATTAGGVALRRQGPISGFAAPRAGTATFLARISPAQRQQFQAVANTFNTRDFDQNQALQRAMNAARPAGTAAIPEDGHWGPKSAAALLGVYARHCIVAQAGKPLNGLVLAALRAEAQAAGVRVPPEVPRATAPLRTPPGHGTPVDPAIRRVSAHIRSRIAASGLPAGFELKIAQSLQGQVHIETSNGTDVRTSDKGARGVIQVIPETAVNIVVKNPENEAFLREAGVIPAHIQGAALDPYIRAHYKDPTFNTYLGGFVMLENAEVARRELGSRASPAAIMERARRIYHGGNDRSEWGPVNARYSGKVDRAINRMLRRGELLTQV